MSVLCVDRGPLHEAGARWVNGVPGWAFDTAGIARPAGEELYGAGDQHFHLVAGWGPTRLVMRGHGVLEVDMRLLVERLQRLAADCGARLEGQVTAVRMKGDRLETDRGEVRTRWAIDASGLGGATLLPCSPVRPSDLCAAAQYVHEVREHAAARSFFERHQVPLGHTLCFTGIAGGFSALNLRSDGDRVSLLAGSIPAEGHPSGSELLRRFISEQRWIGARIFGGARAVPLRRPYDRLAGGRVALLGDAACQVFAAHGSGVGAGLVAAHQLAASLLGGGGVEEYAAKWHRRWGGLFASYDLFRRFSQSLSSAQIARMMDGGLLDAELATDGLAQRHPRIDLRAFPRKLFALGRRPSLARRLGAVGVRMLAARALYARHPRAQKGLRSWSRLVAFALGDTPDPID